MMPKIQESIEKVRGFTNLQRGWHFGDGVAPSTDRIALASQFIRHAGLLGLTRANVFPGINGQIEVTFYDSDRMFELTIEADESVTVAENGGTTQISFTEGLTISQAYERLNAWAFSDLFIDSITTLNVRVSHPWHSTFEVANQFQPLITTAPLPRAGQFVVTSSVITTNRLVEFLPSTGLFQNTYSRPMSELNWSQVLLGTSAIDTSIGGEEMPAESLAA